MVCQLLDAPRPTFVLTALAYHEIPRIRLAKAHKAGLQEGVNRLLGIDKAFDNTAFLESNSGRTTRFLVNVDFKMTVRAEIGIINMLCRR